MARYYNPQWQRLWTSCETNKTTSPVVNYLVTYPCIFDPENQLQNDNVSESGQYIVMRTKPQYFGHVVTALEIFLKAGWTAKEADLGQGDAGAMTVMTGL